MDRMSRAADQCQSLVNLFRLHIYLIYWYEFHSICIHVAEGLVSEAQEDRLEYYAQMWGGFVGVLRRAYQTILAYGMGYRLLEKHDRRLQFKHSRLKEFGVRLCGRD